MSVIIWKNEYSVGNAELDQGHKKLMSMINQLHLAMLEDRGKKIVNTIISDMLEYTQDHMTLEERYMRQSGYLGLLQHHREHAEFLAKAIDLKQRSEEGGFVLSIEVIQYLSEWLNKHILETDMKYIPAFKEKGFCR